MVQSVAWYHRICGEEARQEKSESGFVGLMDFFGLAVMTEGNPADPLIQ